jgi:NTP pyrophosphatase (non-canonical NTP hydrolase)
MNTIPLIQQWFIDKQIIAFSNPLKQIEKTQEEVDETKIALARLLQTRLLRKSFSIDTHDQENEILAEIEDGIGDIVVTLVGICMMLNISLEECTEKAYGVISKRTGKMVNGKFVKDLV